jgi:hypothetical protein
VGCRIRGTVRGRARELEARISRHSLLGDSGGNVLVRYCMVYWNGGGGGGLQLRCVRVEG